MKKKGILTEADRKLEDEIQAEILLGIGKDFSDSIRAWRNNTGSLKIDNRFVRFGLKGQADISGIMEGGRRLEIEVKTSKGVQSQAQKDYDQMITKFGGIYLLARDYETVKRYLKYALSLSRGDIEEL